MFEIRAIVEQSLILEIDPNLRHPRLGGVYEKASIHHLYFVLNDFSVNIQKILETTQKSG